jgi:hypothetical protein
MSSFRSSSAALTSSSNSLASPIAAQQPSWRPRCGSTDHVRSPRSLNVEQHRALRRHHDAAALVDRSEHADPVGQMYDAFIRVLEQRAATRRVEVIPGDIDQTFARFEDALDIGAQ